MRPQKVLDKEILEGLTKVFRSKGYEGASLKELSEATGLKKASLYHRFPNGKQEMANAVLNHLGNWVEENVFNTLLDENLTPSNRLKNGLFQIKTLYDKGHNSCIFRALSMESGLELFEKQIMQGMNKWIAVFSELGLAFGLQEDIAQKKALQALVEIQGSLVVTKIMRDISIFENTLKNIEQEYLR
ncbi:TetR/AcrR family transcriptional regulator [Aquimarina rhabdastrellae]